MTTSNFISDLIKSELESGKLKNLRTRFPPEPNGYLHLGHAKSIFLNFGLVEQFGGQCNLRFDDTNPDAEDSCYIEGIMEDLSWLLGLTQNELKERININYTSDYFDQLYQFAHLLISQGLAYVCDLTPEEMAAHRGSSRLGAKSGGDPDKQCPARDGRSIEDNRILFTQMYQGKFPPGSRTLRAKIDLSSPNMNMRDPIMYRISDANHHRTGHQWRIYPAYDWAHGQSDAIEGITHSICTLEFENHRPLYQWFLEQLKPFLPADSHLPKQIEFSRLNVSRTIMSKRSLKQLIENGEVDGWDDPRLPTLRGLRRRGYTPSALKRFCRLVGVSKNHNEIDLSMLENCLREDQDPVAPRRLVISKPLKIVIENYGDDDEEYFTAPNHPAHPEYGTRQVPFSKEIWIEHDDFMIDPPKKYFRLFLGQEVRLRYACLVTCTSYEVDVNSGEVTGVRVRMDPESRGGQAPDGRKVKGTIGWVSARHSQPIEIRTYEPLFSPNMPETTCKNTQTCLTSGKAEPHLMNENEVSYYQFERQGYFHRDPDCPQLFHRSVTLRDTWGKIKKQTK